MKVFNALANTLFKKKDDTAGEHYRQNQVRSTLEDMCTQYLEGGKTILEFEALPEIMPLVINILQDEVFLERYEFRQIDETRFQIHAKEIDLMG